MEVPQHHITIAQYTAKAIGLEPEVFIYYDDDKTNSIAVLNVVDPLDKNVKFYSTIGLSDYPNIIDMKKGNEDVPVEILITGYKNFPKAANVLGTAAFYIIKNRWDCQPGSVYKGIVESYFPESQLKHVMFITPYLWEDKLTPLPLEDKTVQFLLCVPISEAELNYRNEHGREALEKLLFGEKKIDLFDLNRNSVL